MMETGVGYIFCTLKTQMSKLDISSDEDIQHLDTSTNVRNKVSLFVYFHNNINKILLLHNIIISMCLEHLQQFANSTFYPCFFGKRRKMMLQQFAKALAKFCRVAIWGAFTHIFAR